LVFGIGEIAGRKCKGSQYSDKPKVRFEHWISKKKPKADFHFGLPLSLSDTQITKYLKIYHSFL
jgi:hypothetical protein